MARSSELFHADRGAQSVFTRGSYNASRDRSSHPTSGPYDCPVRDTEYTLLLTRTPDPPPGTTPCAFYKTALRPV
jgi:hypothetical protein